MGEMLFWNRLLRGVLGARHAISFKIEFEMDFVTWLPAIAGKWDSRARLSLPVLPSCCDSQAPV